MSRSETPAYDTLGIGYNAHRRPDPRIGAAVGAALAGADRVVNVGAGTGGYEPTDRAVVAVEPSSVMVAQRPPFAAPCVRGVAEHLPFADATFEAALAVLTIHHWADAAAGLAELRRVAPDRQVILSWDLAVSDGTWLVTDYLPSIAALSRGLACADDVMRLWPDARSTVVPVPGDCTDGFLGAYWRRPEALLDPSVRDGISTFSMLDRAAVADGLARLESDLASGAWHERHGHLLDLDSLDVGYRLVVAGPG